MIIKNKLLVASLLILLVTAQCFAKIVGSRFKIAESEKEFDVMYYLTEDMTIAENKVNDDVSVTQTFTIDKNGQKAEVRYSLFTDCGEDDSDLQIQYAMWVFMCISNATGFEVPNSAISKFNDDDVKKEFNGDFGCTAFIQDPKSDYASGYKYMMVEFFYKHNQGLVMRSFLFNDMDFIGMTPDGLSADSIWYANYHTFEFMEKDEAGNYIHN